MPHNRRRLGIAAAAIGNSIFGFSFMFSRMALSVATPYVMLMYRFVAAFLALGCIGLWAKRTGRQGWLRFDLKLRQAAPLLLLGIAQPVVYFLCESYGISLTNATVSGVIIALVPIAALGAGVVVLGEKPCLAQIGFALLSIAGVALMTLQQTSQGDVQPLGVLLLLGAVASAAAFNLLSRKMSARYSVLERTVVMMLVGAVTFTGLAVWENAGAWHRLVQPLGSPAFLGAVAYLSLLSSVVAFLLLNYANTELPVAQSTVFCNLTTVISLLAGAVFLGEPFNAVSLIASAIIITGVWGVQRQPGA